MKQKKRYFLAGLFVIGGFLLFALGCILFGGSELFSEKLYFETYFASSVQGLDVGSAVKFRGVPMGKVESITFTADTYRNDPAVLECENTKEVFHSLMYIRVLCSINLKDYPSYSPERLKQMVERGMRATLGMQGITGIVFINLDYYRANKANDATDLKFVWTPEKIYVPSKLTVLQNIIDVVDDLSQELRKVNLSQTVASFTKLADSVNLAVSEANLPQLSATFNELGQSLAKQAHALEATLAALDAEALGKNVKALSDNLAATSTTLREVMPQLSSRVDDTMVSVQDVLGELKVTLIEVNSTLSEVRSAVNFDDLGEEADQTFGTLARTAASLEALVDELREKPSRLIFDSPEQ